MPRQVKRMHKKPKSSLRSKVLKIVKSQAEKKNLDQSEDDSTIIAGQPFNMAIGMPAQGDTDSTRDGSQIKLNNIYFRGELSLAAAAIEGALLRIIVIRTPFNNVDGSAPIASFTSMTPNGFYPRNLPFSYKVYKDVVYSLGIGEKNKRLVKFTIPTKDLIKFDGTGATNVANHKYSVLGLTEHATVSEISMEANTRLHYYDS